MKKLIIGLAGKAEHGKTVTARIMCEAVAQDGGFGEIIEASLIIAAHCIKLGLLPKNYDQAKRTKEQLKVLVSEGSRMRNEVDPNYWTHMIVDRMLVSKAKLVVCPNLRFPQEAEGIKAIGGHVIRLVRLNRDGSPFVSETRDPNHETETALDRWPADFYLFNQTGHGALLEAQVRTLYDYIAALETE